MPLVGQLNVSHASMHAYLFYHLSSEEDIVSLYEHAWHLYPHSEEMGVELFYSCIKTFSFKKANQAAMRLYKKTHDNKYYMWAILTLYNQSQLTEKDESENGSLGLVQKMIEKAVDEKKMKDFQDFSLCLLLCPSEKDDRLVQSLVDVPMSVFPSAIDGHKWKLQLLHHQKKWSEIMSVCQSMTPIDTM